MAFLLDVNEKPFDVLQSNAEEMLRFVESLEMGAFYYKQIKNLVETCSQHIAWTTETPQEALQQWDRDDTEAYRKLLEANKDQILSLVVEMLRYQDWTNDHKARTRE